MKSERLSSCQTINWWINRWINRPSINQPTDRERERERDLKLMNNEEPVRMGRKGGTN